ncbi:hypothetical protein OSB04_un001003 [Centaurea solstitialis]|uniref:STI1 domain-containing protein n=1 Tax=Centaurea solstitialis TaxID=347529 RepID=A0AA38S310_9ASTR|nr:hypothetical protein OSB04_un001003 [Centaurea solstitialis]
MDGGKLEQLKLFVRQCKSDPSILSDPPLSFYRDYLESLGAKLPSSVYKTESKPYVVDEDDVEDVEEPQEEEEEEDENRDASQEAKAKGMEAISDGNLEEAIEHLTEAILLNPTSAIMYAARASVYIKMKKPNAAIRDADAALQINPDSAKGYKSRGIARSMLGQWEEAAKDLHAASIIDFDEEISAILKKVEPNAHKIVEHRRKYDKLRKEREDRKTERERQRGRAEAKANFIAYIAAYEKAKREEKASSSDRAGGMPGGFFGGMPGGFPGGMPGGFFGGMPGGFPGGMPGGFPGGMPGGFGGGMPGGGMPGGFPGAGGGMPGGIDYSKILNDPELMAAFEDPEVMAALQDVMKNPANLAKHQGNPKLAPLIAKMMSKFGGPK